MKPFDGNAVMELNPSLVFPILEMLLGGTGKSGIRIARETTEIEQSILDGLFRIILNDLRAAWSQVSNIAFSIAGRETEPQLLQILAPNEAIVSIGLEIRIGETSGMMNIGFPSIIIKMLRGRFDQQWSMRRTDASSEHQERMLNLVKPARLLLDARLAGPMLQVGDMLKLKAGDVLQLDYPVSRPLHLLVNGKIKYEGFMVGTSRKKGFRIDSLVNTP
jgi:flagellar motor switch protein FliM